MRFGFKSNKILVPSVKKQLTENFKKNINIMESRIIYESDKTYLEKISWIKFENNSESEWRYLNPKSLTEKNVEEIFNASFGGNTIYLVTNRNESKVISKSNLFSEIKSLFGEMEFRVWNEYFENVVEFKLEVYRKGLKPAGNSGLAQ